MDTQEAQARNSGRTIKVFVALVLLNLVVAWVAISFDQPANANLGDITSASAAETGASGSSASGKSGPAAGASTQEAEDSRKAAASKPVSQAVLQAAIRAANASDRDTDVSPQVGRTLSNIIELLNADKIDEAIAELDTLTTSDVMAQMSPFELSRLYQLSFNLNMQKENYSAAHADIQAAIESGGLDARELSQMTYQDAQLFVMEEDYPKATDSLELWLAEQKAAPLSGVEPNPGAYYLLAAAYYYQDRFDDARDHMETLFSMPGEKQEGWYSMLSSLYMRDEDYTRALPIVKQMVDLYGRETYRQQLAGIYLQNDDYASAIPVIEKLVEMTGDEKYKKQLSDLNRMVNKAQ
jgi:tetratricopeptide (TPR) repeat protein